MFGGFVQTVLNVPFSYLAPTLEFVSLRMHVPLFKECSCPEPKTSQSEQLTKEGHVCHNGIHIQSIFNLYDHVINEHRILERTHGYEFNPVDRKVVMRTETNLQLLEKEWRKWKGQPNKEFGLAVKWESVYVAQLYYEETKDLMMESGTQQRE